MRLEVSAPEVAGGVSGPEVLRVVEPQMTNLFHAPFNAAFLHTIALGFSSTKLVFHAQQAHLEAVLQIIQDHAPAVAERISWQPLPAEVPGSPLQRWWRTRRVFRSLLAEADPLIFCSISRLQLLVLKLLMGPGDIARCVLHGELESVLREDRFPAKFVSLRHALATEQPAGLRYLLLGVSIARNLPRSVRDGMGEPGVLDHPYHFPQEPAAPKRLANGLVIGIFGNTGDARVLERVARAVLAKTNRVRFQLVGFLQDDATARRIEDVVTGGTAIPISRAHFRERAQGLTHALWLAEPGGFRVRASGTFFDALAYQLPLFYTANAYLDAYGIAEVGAGVRCASIDATAEAIVRLAEEADSQTIQAAYEKQVGAIQTFRERFSPEALATQVAAALAL